MRRFTSILLILALPAAAAAAGPEVPESVYQKFLSALPDAQRLTAASHGADPKELAQLSGLNPGKEAQVQAILDGYERCIGPASDAAMDRMFRHVARSLGEEKIRRLTGFYQGADFARVNALFGRIEAGETLPAAEQAEADALLVKYPLAEFRDAMVPAGQDLLNDKPFIDAVTACAMTREEAMEREQIRLSAD